MTRFVVTEPNPPTEWPRMEKAPRGRTSGSSVRGSASSWGMPRTKVRRPPRAISSTAATKSPGRTSRLPSPAAAAWMAGTRETGVEPGAPATASANAALISVARGFD